MSAIEIFLLKHALFIDLILRIHFDLFLSSSDSVSRHSSIIFSKSTYCCISSVSSLMSVFVSSGIKTYLNTFYQISQASMLNCVHNTYCSLHIILVLILWKTVRDGFLGFSRSKDLLNTGTPRVTFDLDATPAKWNVFKCHLCSRLTDRLCRNHSDSLSWRNNPFVIKNNHLKKRGQSNLIESFNNQDLFWRKVIIIHVLEELCGISMI